MFDAVVGSFAPAKKKAVKRIVFLTTIAVVCQFRNAGGHSSSDQARHIIDIGMIYISCNLATTWEGLRSLPEIFGSWCQAQSLDLLAIQNATCSMFWPV